MPKITPSDIANAHRKKPQKRKKVFAHKSVAKKSRHEAEIEDESTEQFRYVLAPKNQHNTDSSTEEEDITIESPPKLKKKPMKKANKDAKATKKSSKENSGNVVCKKQSKKVNGAKIKSQIMTQYESDESDDSYLFEDMESMSEEEEESCEDEWSTDTDFSPHSFHESDCESVDSDDEEDISESDEDSSMESCDYNSTEDHDYIPPIEDKYVKKGDAIMYDAKGLDLAFGDTSESQIIELDDVSAAVVESDEEVPQLLPINGEIEESEQNGQSESVGKAEVTFKNLSLNDDDEAVEGHSLLQRASFHNCISNRGVIAKINRTIHFHGILVIKPIVNSIQVNGFTLPTNQSLKATSISRTDYFLNLTPVICKDRNVDETELRNELKDLFQTENEVDAILDGFNPQKDVLLHLQQGLPDKGVEMLQTYLSDPVLPHKNMILKKSVCPSSELTLATKFFVDSENPRLNAFRVNEDWNHMELKNDTKLVVIGGKNVGKSAMTQYLINKHISKHPKILLIDLDIGQPICGASQTVSATLISQPLIGAGFLNNTKADKSFLFGDKSIMLSPFKYNECVARLMDFCNCNEEYKNIPWIINTMGYQKGFGLQLMCLLLRVIQPNEVVQIQHSNQRYNFKEILKESIVNDFSFSFFSESYLQKYPRNVHFTTHVLDSIVNNGNVRQNQQTDDDDSQWTSNATEKRKISILAQLSRLMKGGQTYLNDVIPYGTSMEKIRMIVIDEDYGDYNGVNLDLFNGNLVYLCGNFENNDTLDSNSILECYGIGIVRAVDKVHNYIYILLPQQDDSEKLKAMINVLALGNIPLPAEILLKQNFGVTGTVPFVTFFKDRNMSHKKYINKRNIKDCF